MQLANALSTAIYAPLHRTDRILLMASEIEVILTFILCAFMLYKKKALGNFWIATKRSSPYGTFYVANAVFTLVLGVTGYLVALTITFFVITAFFLANFSTFEWYWIIPLPWLPLVLGAWVSTHGFAVGCSPRSPLSFISQGAAAQRLKWYHLPITRSAIAANTALVLPCVLLTCSTFGLCAKAGHSYYSAKHFAHQVLPADIQHQMSLHAAGKASFLGDADQLASDQLIWLARQAAAGYFEAFRYSCINLAIYAASAYALFIPAAGYGIPNIMSLVDHTCSCHPTPLPASYTTYFHKLWFLLTKARPKAKDAASQRNLATWKMTILSNIYVYLMVGSVPAFAFVPIYVVSQGFPHAVLAGHVGPVLDTSLLAVSIITILACTTIAIFCTVATLDPLFRAAIGLNVIRMQMPININVDFERVEVEEKGAISSAGRTDKSGKDLETNGKRKLALKPSTSSTGSTSKASPTTADFPDYAVDSHFVVEMRDGKSAASRESHADKIKDAPPS